MNIKKIGILVMVMIVTLFMTQVVSAADVSATHSHHHHKAKFYTDHSHYHPGEVVSLTLENKDHDSIYVPCNGIIDIRHSGETVAEVEWDLEGYGYDDMCELEPGDRAQETWDPWNDYEKANVIGYIPHKGSYKAYTDYVDAHDRDITVKTKNFKLK